MMTTNEYNLCNEIASEIINGLGFTPICDVGCIWNVFYKQAKQIYQVYFAIVNDKTLVCKIMYNGGVVFDCFDLCDPQVNEQCRKFVIGYTNG